MEEYGIASKIIKNTHEVTSKLLYQNWLHPYVTIAMEILHQESAAMPRWRTCRGTQCGEGIQPVPTGFLLDYLAFFAWCLNLTDFNI